MAKQKRTNNKPRRQHWVPCFYLRHFATPETKGTEEPAVWILSKDQGDPRCTSVRQVAAENFLYSPTDQSGSRDWSMEEKLRDLEGTMASIWPLLTDGLTDLYGDAAIRKGLALFMSLLYLRHPRRLFDIDSIHSQMVAAYDDLPKDTAGDR